MGILIMEKNTIYLGDCLDLMRGVKDKSIDLILCDLPYGTTACKWDTVIPLPLLWSHYEKIIKNDGVIVLTAAQPFTSALVMSNLKRFKYCWYWIKNEITGFANAKKQPLRNVEDVCVFSKSKGLYFPQGLTALNKARKNGTSVGGDTLKGSDSLNVKGNLRNADYWHLQEFTGYPRQTLTGLKRENKKEHPTQKPVALFEYLIKTYTNEGALVLDNCAGSGTTAIACINTNRNFICMEKDEQYFKLAQDRIFRAALGDLY